MTKIMRSREPGISPHSHIQEFGPEVDINTNNVGLNKLKLVLINITLMKH